MGQTPLPQLFAIVCLLFPAVGGCVERRMTIRTNPPGALCYVDDNEIGITPVSTPFIYYGNRKIRLVKDGYETQTFLQSVPPPWYEIPPLDFFSETLTPGKLRDQHSFDYQLVPQGVVPREQLLGRAEALRCGTHTASGVSTPGFRVNPPASGPGPYAPPNVQGGIPMIGQPIQQPPPGAFGPGGGPPPDNLPPAYAPPAAQPDAGSLPNYPLLPGGR